MRKVLMLLTFGLLLFAAQVRADEADTESLVGQTYTGQTTALPDGTVFVNAGTSPGVYSQLSGSYVVNLSSKYYQISSFLNWTEGKALVVNQDNVIVYEAKITLTPAGGRSFTEFGIVIPEEDAITTPGTYRIIYPTSSGWDVTNAAYITPRESEPIYNMVAGPYVVGEIKAPVEAQVTVEPQGTFTEETSPEFVTITVANADIFNCEDLDNVITVKYGNTAITMEPGVKTGNTLKWEFPYDAATDRAAILAGGDYTISVNWAAIKGYTAELNPLQFPDGVSEYKFTMEGGMEKVTPKFTLNPAAGHYDKWTAQGLTIALPDYQLLTATQGATVMLRVIDPDMQVVDYKPFRAYAYQFGYKVDMTKEGDYKMILKLDGLEGKSRTNTDAPNVLLQDVEFEYSIGNPPVEATYATSPAAGASITTTEFNQVEITITNAATLEVAANAPVLVSVIEESTQESITMQAPVVEGNKITWKLPEGREMLAGNYSISFSLAEGLSGKTADGADLKFPETFEYTVTLTDPVTYELVDPNPTFSPEAGNYTKWTATALSCTWDPTYKLDKDGRDSMIGRTYTIQQPDGNVLEFVLTKATDKGVGKVNFLKTELTVTADMFAQPGKYIVTFPIKGVRGYKVNPNDSKDYSEAVEFAENAVVEYVILPPAVDAQYTLTPEAETQVKSGATAPDVVLTITNAATVAVKEGVSTITVTETANNTAVEMQAPVIDGNVITWKFPENWDKPAGTYSISINPAAFTVTAENGASVTMPASITTSIVVEAPELVDPNPTFSPAAGTYTKWTATTLSCTWDPTYKLDKAGRDSMIGRTYTIQQPDGNVIEIVLSKATDSGVGKVNFLKTELTVTADMFAQPGKYIVTFPIKGVRGYKVNPDDSKDYSNAVEFAENAVVEYVILPPAVAADYTIAPAPATVVKPDQQMPDVVLTITNASTVELKEGESTITVTETADNVAVDMQTPVIDGNVITWKFPENWDKPAGTYSISINPAAFTATAENGASVTMPASITTSVTVEAPVVAPKFTVTPEPGRFHTWTATEIVVGLTDYKFASAEEAATAKLTITGPAGEPKEFAAVEASTTAESVAFAVTDADLAQLGNYACVLNLDGLNGLSLDEKPVKVKFSNVSFSYERYAAPINAQYTLTPAAGTEFKADDVMTGIDLTIDNALTLSIAEGVNPITVVETADNVTVEMQAPVIEGNKVTWKFPEGWNNPAGEYTVTIDLASFTGAGADDAEVIFPAKVETTFSIAPALVTPAFTVNPAAGEYDEAIEGKVTVTLTDCAIRDAADTADAVLTITNAAGDKSEYRRAATESTASKLVYIVNDSFMSALGQYTCTVALDGIAGVTTDAAARKVMLQSVSFDYTIAPRETEIASVKVTPENGTAVGIWTAPEIAVTWEGYTLDAASVALLKSRKVTVSRDGTAVAELDLDTPAALPVETTDTEAGASTSAQVTAQGVTITVDPMLFATDGEYTVEFPLQGLTGIDDATKVFVEFASDASVKYRVDKTLGIDSIVFDDPEGAYYYTIDGLRVERPTRRGIYIRIDKTGKSSRILVK